MIQEKVGNSCITTSAIVYNKPRGFIAKAGVNYSRVLFSTAAVIKLPVPAFLCIFQCIKILNRVIAAPPFYPVVEIGTHGLVYVEIYGSTRRCFQITGIRDSIAICAF